MSFEDILTLLIGTAEVKADPPGLIEACRKFNMKEIDYFNTTGDPLFRTGYWFVFNAPNGEEALLEIIEIEGGILQAGIQIIYKENIALKNNPDFSFLDDFVSLYNSLKSYYIREQKQFLQEIEMFEFFNEISQCYIRKSRINGSPVLTFRVTNKEIWARYNLKH